jgi:hypothetical protein
MAGPIDPAITATFRLSGAVAAISSRAPHGVLRPQNPTPPRRRQTEANHQATAAWVTGTQILAELKAPGVPLDAVNATAKVFPIAWGRSRKY